MWKVTFEPDRRLVHLRLTDHVPAAQMRELARAHAQALSATAGQRFRVLADLRGLFPLDADAVTLFTEIKRIAADSRGFAGCAVLADSPTIAMQQHRTRRTTGSGEVITLDEREVKRFLADGAGGPQPPSSSR